MIYAKIVLEISIPKGKAYLPNIMPIELSKGLDVKLLFNV